MTPSSISERLAIVSATDHSWRQECSEHAACGQLLEQARRLGLDHGRIVREAGEWTLAARSRRRPSLSQDLLDAFGLATEEGKASMRLAEALLRTPDRATAWHLICENLTSAPWSCPITAGPQARLATWVLRAAANLLLRRPALLATLAVPMVGAARLAVRAIADRFIVAENMTDALRRMRRERTLRLCSIDCLGESARTKAQADHYFEAYARAIGVLARQSGPVHARHGVSIKLSALEPRFGPRHRGTYCERLIPVLRELARQAARAGIGLTIDAEEQDRLQSTLDVFAALTEDPLTRDWEGLGMAVQAYGLRAEQVIAWLASMARRHRRRLTVRLVKGAYWDSEIKRAQERGLHAFPVWTDKRATDVSYLVAASRLFQHRDVIFPQFATHNALTVAAVRALAPANAAFEFQRLHGMGEALYGAAVEHSKFPPVRVYAPVGSRQDLLAYLIRRMLENGANSSFVRGFLDPAVSLSALLEDPIGALSRRMECCERAPG